MKFLLRVFLKYFDQPIAETLGTHNHWRENGTQNVFNSVSIGSNKTMSSAQKTAEVQSPPGDTVSCLRFSPESMQTTFLAATSWDNRIRIWEVQANGSTIPKAEQMHQGLYLGLVGALMVRKFSVYQQTKLRKCGILVQTLSRKLVYMMLPLKLLILLPLQIILV
ncbi:unnamed protein product [Schistosoma mattheei]|uniref:WD_REPEATS_REGION domain-containing protein n=1 Tax=Schistosoma mattheei TaxID=31246 RepID=A0AA85AYC8_9TREM|nr:unnamed protein product [Schistosoma mattheei]